MLDPRVIFTSVIQEARGKIRQEFCVDNELQKVGNFAGIRTDRLAVGEVDGEGCPEWVGRIATKSAASGTTNQIFALAARSRGPLLLFICKAGLNYGGVGRRRRWRRILRPGSDHCATC